MKNGAIKLQFFRKIEISTKEHGNFLGMVRYTYIRQIVKGNLIGKSLKTVN